MAVLEERHNRAPCEPFVRRADRGLLNVESEHFARRSYTLGENESVVSISNGRVDHDVAGMDNPSNQVVGEFSERLQLQLFRDGWWFSEDVLQLTNRANVTHTSCSAL